MSMPVYVEIAREPGNPHHQSVTDVPVVGWALLPEALVEQFEACGGYCNLTIANGEVTGITPDAKTPVALYATIREKEAEIAEAKAKLTGGDYKVIKAYEAALLGKPAPYDMAAEIQERDALRADINAAEEAVAAAREAADTFYAEANANREAYK